MYAWVADPQANAWLTIKPETRTIQKRLPTVFSHILFSSLLSLVLNGKSVDRKVLRQNKTEMAKKNSP